MPVKDILFFCRLSFESSAKKLTFTNQNEKIMNVQIEESWKKQLQPEFEKDYFIKLTDFVRNEYAST